MNDTFLEFIAEALGGAMMATFAAAPVALLVLAVDRTVGKWMTPHTRCWMWMLVALRLLMPIAPGSPVSAQNLWELLGWESKSTFHQVEQTSMQDHFKNLILSEYMSSDRLPITPQPVAAVASAPVVPAAWDWEEIFAISVLLLWLAGVVFVLLRAVVASLRFAWRLRAIPCTEDQAILDVVLRVCDLVGIGRQLRVKYVPDLPAPALFGLFRPTLCLPKETPSSFSHAELRMIVIHEAMHVRRFDGYLSWLLTLVRAIHWFNPIAWLTIQQIENYREQACDDAVRRFTEPQERGVYADLLLRFATVRPTASLGLLGLWFARPAKRLAARIKTFSSTGNDRRRFPQLLAGSLVVLLSVVGLTDAANRNMAKKSLPPLPFAPSSFLPDIKSDSALPEIITPTTIEEARTLAQNTAKVEDREYDLTAALKKIGEIRPEEDARQWLMSYYRYPPVLMKQPAVVQTGDDPNRITVTTSRQGHEYFENLLDEVVRFGHTWQVTVEPRVFHGQQIEQIQGIDWQEAVKFPAPAPAEDSPWPSSARASGDEGLSLSMESVSYEYAPYSAILLKEGKIARVIKQLETPEQVSPKGSPKVTLFSGQQGTLQDESFSSFVFGVNYIHGAFATAAQPIIAVLPKGTKLDIQARVVTSDTLDLKCRLKISLIEEVNQAKLPGQEITVATARATHRTLSVRCRVKRGEILLLAPVAGSDPGGFYYAISTDWFPDPAEVDD